MANPAPTFDLLLAYAAGELTGAQAADVEAHVKSSADAAATVGRLRAAIHAMRGDDTVPASARALARAKGVFDPRQFGTKLNWIEHLRQVAASLVFDSRLEPALAGYRGEEQGFEVSFEGGPSTVDLQLEPVSSESIGGASRTASSERGELWHVMGQVTTEVMPAEIEVALVPPGSPFAACTTPTDAHGVFSLRVPRGRYDLLVRLGECVMVTPSIEIA